MNKMSQPALGHYRIRVETASTAVYRANKYQRKIESGYAVTHYDVPYNSIHTR
ncbi:hypothetical protein [Trueperella sp. LYQ143]|uniref:hypothetical protein n=1 Tax=Trueperella sp. LYQ143 TaxID=3391059 RepID=UPI0039833B71